MSWGKRVRMYDPAEKIESLLFAVGSIERGEYLFVRGRLTHPAVIRNWSLAMIESLTKGGHLRRAFRTGADPRLQRASH